MTDATPARQVAAPETPPPAGGVSFQGPAAKEAAQVVLADNHFASIVAALHEGRTVYDNIRKVIACRCFCC